MSPEQAPSPMRMHRKEGLSGEEGGPTCSMAPTISGVQRSRSSTSTLAPLSKSTAAASARPLDAACPAEEEGATGTMLGADQEGCAPERPG